MNIAEAILKTRADIAGLSVFSALKKHPLIQSLDILLEDVFRKAAPLDLVRDWAGFTETFTREGWVKSFYFRIVFLTITDDNAFTRGLEAAAPDRLPPALCALAGSDLSRLGRIAAFDLPGLGTHLAGLLANAGLGESAAAVGKEAEFLSGGTDAAVGAGMAGLFPKNTGWGEALPKLGAYIRAHGAGEMGLYSFFSWSAGPQSGFSLRPVFNPDPIRLADLSGYEDQRSVVTANTLRFLEGKIANNLLLYGDRGTGKSATVKAVCNEYTGQGLRLVEVRKGNLPELPAILNILSSRALRFIVFIDDLSFESAGDSFTDLKALLEGSVESRPDNVVVYATSNRRHLVKERLSDRPSSAEAANAASTGDIRAFDTMQEQFSLADRFGITVIYTAPNQDEYLRIACFIGQRRGVLGTGEEEQQRFRDNALRWERWFNGRSPRTAAQYVEWVAGGAGFPWES
ncbi:MAG: ATP-binding protein [Treponema sp.]|jgi:predicted AAA+ superfamily ATPase|nr:ATP-binding protein [Treponema sp.]